MLALITQGLGNAQIGERCSSAKRQSATTSQISSTSSASGPRPQAIIFAIERGFKGLIWLEEIVHLTSKDATVSEIAASIFRFNQPLQLVHDLVLFPKLPGTRRHELNLSPKLAAAFQRENDVL